MDAELKAKWVAALRSGEYVQGIGALRRTDREGSFDTWCCLGVLCNVTDGVVWGRDDEEPYWYAALGDARDSLMPPARLASALGLYVEQDHLAEMNDNGATFERIADWIEGNL